MPEPQTSLSIESIAPNKLTPGKSMKVLSPK